MLLTELSLAPRLCAHDMSRISTTWEAICCWCFFSAARWLRFFSAALAPLKGYWRAFQTEACALEATVGCCCSFVGASMLCLLVCAGQLRSQSQSSSSSMKQMWCKRCWALRARTDSGHETLSAFQEPAGTFHDHLHALQHVELNRAGTEKTRPVRRLWTLRDGFENSHRLIDAHPSAARTC